MSPRLRVGVDGFFFFFFFLLMQYKYIGDVAIGN